MEEEIKPQLGILPRDIYDDLRIKELGRAIFEYTNHCYGLGEEKLIIKWIEELHEKLERRVRENGSR